MAEQIKSRERVTDHGEVFTADREVKAMCDLVANECVRIDSRFLEPACGDGNFLAEILGRKLAVVTATYKRRAYDWERFSLIALGSLYGVDILSDNCQICRDRLYDIWAKEYKSVCKKECNDDTRRAARFILDRNIVCGNALTLMCVDESQRDTDVPIIFSEWAFVGSMTSNSSPIIQRSDYTFAELMKEKAPEKKTQQTSIFDTPANDGEGTFIQKYTCHYRKLGLNENGDEATDG